MGPRSLKPVLPLAVLAGALLAAPSARAADTSSWLSAGGGAGFVHNVTLNQDDVNILIFATFTEHKELFMGSTEIRDLISKNEKNLKLLFHEMNSDIQATFSMYRKLIKENNTQFKFRMFQWLKKGLEIKAERNSIMKLVNSFRRRSASASTSLQSRPRTFARNNSTKRCRRMTRRAWAMP